MNRTWTANVVLDYSAGGKTQPRQLVFAVEFRIAEDELNGVDARDDIQIDDWYIEQVITKGNVLVANNSVFTFAFDGLFGDAIEEWSPMRDRVYDQCLESAKAEYEAERTPQPVDEMTLIK